MGCRSLECVLEGAFFWKELACSGQWCCFSWFRVACRSRRRGGREDGRLRKTGAAGQRREEARGRTGKKTKRGLQENRPRPDFRKSLHHDSALHLSLLWRMEKERCVRDSRNPLVLLQMPSPPHGTIGPFRPRVQDNTNRTSFLHTSFAKAI